MHLSRTEVQQMPCQQMTYLCFKYLAVLNTNHYGFSHPQNETNKKRNKIQNGGAVI